MWAEEEDEYRGRRGGLRKPVTDRGKQRKTERKRKEEDGSARQRKEEEGKYILEAIGGKGR